MSSSALVSAAEEAKAALVQRHHRIHQHNQTALALSRDCDRAQAHIDQEDAKAKDAKARLKEAVASRRAAEAAALDTAHTTAVMEAKEAALAEAVRAIKEEIGGGEGRRAQQATDAFRAFSGLFEMMAVEPAKSEEDAAAAGDTGLAALRAQVAEEEVGGREVQSGAEAAAREAGRLQDEAEELKGDSKALEGKRWAKKDAIDAKAKLIEKNKRKLYA